MAKHRGIAITGLNKAGKSVFLVSLLQHLKYSSPEKFRLRDKKIKGFEILPVKDKFFKQFPFEDLRATLTAEKGGVLPPSTRDACKFAFRLSTEQNRPGGEGRWAKISKFWDEVEYVFEFIDFPGERLADIEIYANESFAGWSDAIESSFQAHAHIYENLKDYRAIIEDMSDLSAVGAKEGANRLAAGYKKALTAMMKNKVQLITPSSFRKEFESGREFTRDDFDNHGENRPCGIPGYDFVPVPERFRERCPNVTKVFADNFERYRKEAITPLFDAFKKCDSLLYLVDIPDILSNSSEKYDEIARLLEKLGESLNRSGRLKGLREALSGGLKEALSGGLREALFGGLSKVLFVATKSDMVSDADQENLRLLTESLMNPLGRSMPKASCEVHVISAWVSTSYYQEDPYLLNSMVLAQPLKSGNPGDLEDMQYRVSKIPDAWPDKGWREGEYQFPEQALYPLRLQTTPPRHRNLNEVFLALLAG